MYWVIPCEITHLKNTSLPIVIILSTQSLHQKKIDKQKSYVQMKLAGFCLLTKIAHPVTLEPEVTGGCYSGL